MSLDKTCYDELRRRQHPAAKWWMIGDCSYYLGLLGAVFLGCAARWVQWALWAAGIAVVVFFLGVACKRRAYVLAARDGVRVDDY